MLLLQFASLWNLQNVLCDLAGGHDEGLGKKFVSCACTISKLRIASCKLHRLTNRTQHYHYLQC